jgi:transcription elongation factor GreA
MTVVATEGNEQLTTKQRAAVEAELAELEGPRRTAVVQAIKTAREHGDLSENFEYHAAKNEQGLLERRITLLRDRLDRAVIVDADDVASDTVGIGTQVEIEDEHGERTQLEISSVGGVSPDSPVGRALLGRKPGDEVEIDAPRGSWRARIISISRSEQ